MMTTKSVVFGLVTLVGPAFACHSVPMRTLPMILATLPLVAALAACGGESVDASCDVDGITHEVEHILSEAGAELGSLDSLTCDADWAFTTTTIVTNGQESADSFLLRGTDMGWILTSPEEACSPGTPFAIPEGLRATACAT